MVGERAYQVLRITELLRPSDRGGVEPYYQHTIKTRGGTVLTVDVTKADFTPERTAPLLTAAATNADKILAG